MFGQYPTAAPPPLGNPYDSYKYNYNQTGDPAVAIRSNLAQAGNWGSRQATNLSGQQDYQQQLAQMYGGAANATGAQVLANPGYTSDEMSHYVDPSAYNKGVTSADQFASLDPTAAETEGIQGDPASFSKPLENVSPAMLSNIGNASTKADTITGDATAAQGHAIGQEGDTFNGINSDASLSPSAGYYSALGDDVSSTQSKVDSALDPSKLSLNLDPNYQMSDAEVQDIQNQAGVAANLSRTADFQKTQHDALAAGNADPLALAALNRENETMKASDSANAETSARIAAEDAQRGTKLNYAEANLGANQTSAGLRSSGALQEGQFAAGTQQAATNTQLSAAQNLANMRTGQATTMANQGIGAAQYTGSQGASNTADYAALYNQALQYQGTQGTNVAEAQNAASTGAASQLYNIRQGNTQYGQQQGFNQNYLTQQQLSSLYGNAANQRIAQQNAGLGWSTGEQNTATNAGLTLNGQQNQAAATTLGSQNQAAGQWANYNLGTSSQGFGNQFTSALGSSLGKSIGSGFGTF